MELKDVKEYLETNKDNSEVQELLSSFVVDPTLEDFKSKLETDDEFKSFLDSEKDKHTAKALETWKSNNLPKLIDEKVSELHPEADPKDLKMKELENTISQIQADAKRKELTNVAFKVASEKGLPVKLVDRFIGEDEESTLANMEELEEIYTGSVESTLKSRMKNNGDRITKGRSDFNSVSKEDFEDMSYTEKTELYSENKARYDELTK